MPVLKDFLRFAVGVTMIFYAMMLFQGEPWPSWGGSYIFLFAGALLITQK